MYRYNVISAFCSAKPDETPTAVGRVSDPHHFTADQNLSFHFNAYLNPNVHFNVDPHPAHYQSEEHLRPLIYRPSRASFASIVSVFGPPWLHFEPLKLLNVDFNADPDPPFPL